MFTLHQPGLSVVVATLTLVTAAPLNAQEATNARDVFQLGVAAMEEQDHEGALAHFRRAQSLHAHGVNLFNIGYCQEELERFREAIGSYRLALESGELSDGQRDDAQLRIERLEGLLATLVILGPPMDVHVGDVVCTAPCRLQLNPGAQHIRWAGGSRDVRIPPGAITEVHIELPVLIESPEELGETSGEVERPSPQGTAWLIAGAALGVVGAGGIVGFGLHTENLKERFDMAPGADQMALQDQGVRARRLTNGAIGVAATGAILLLVGIILRARQSPVRAEGTQVTVHF